jgi:hypothetical protein
MQNPVSPVKPVRAIKIAEKQLVFVVCLEYNVWTDV